MSISFRKRVKIAPGINLNFSKSGISTSIGPKGAKINIGKKGAYLNTSIPGSGIYSRTKLAGSPSISNKEKPLNKNAPSLPLGLALFLWLIIIGIFLFALFL